MNKIEIETRNIDFKHVFKIVKIDIDKITLKKYEIKTPTTSLMNSGKSTIELGEFVGEESYTAIPDLIIEIAGKVGLIIPRFVTELRGKTRKKVLMTKIFKFEE